MVTNILLQQEYKKRGITVSDAGNPASCTRGAAPADPRRIRSSKRRASSISTSTAAIHPARSAKESGFGSNSNSTIAARCPSEKLFEQIAGQSTSPTRSCGARGRTRTTRRRSPSSRFDPATIPDSAVHVRTPSSTTYFDAITRPSSRIGPGAPSCRSSTIPRTVTAADTAAARTKADGAPRGDRRRREVRGRREARVGRFRLRGQRRRPGQGRQGTVREAVREGRVRAQAGRAVAARADAVRLPHHPGRRAQGRHDRRAPHPAPHPQSDSSAAISGSRRRLALEGGEPRQASEVRQRRARRSGSRPLTSTVTEGRAAHVGRTRTCRA